MIKLGHQKLKISFTVSTVLIAVLLSGCASKIDRVNEQNLVSDFVAQANVAGELSGADETNWWQKLDSSQLNQLVTDALVNNHNLHTSQLTLKSALARLGEQKAQYLPQGGVEIAAQRSGLGETNSRQSSANIALDWQLDLFGRISALVDAAKASAMSQAEKVRLL